MDKHRSAARWCAGALMAGALLLGATAPAQADTGWNGTAKTHPHSHAMKPADTGWNGT
jgi:uncharacterized low-complexity protein